ncbi:MAG: bifunctional UDP-sugar hydrolase/5'-nucleotidase [Bacteriovoracaceae bacterium]
MNLIKSILVLTFITFIYPVHGEIIQILHTNDLHGFFENSGFDKAVGGFGALKIKMDELRREAAQSGVRTITLDAGDFLEGNLFYLADFGAFNFRMMNDLNYDAVVMGNHDWLMGTQALDYLLERANFDFSLLSANLKIKDFYQPRYPSIEEKIKPYKIIEVNQYKIAILGLSTNDPLYSWRFQDGVVQDPISVAKKYAKFLKKEMKVDFIIALTHLGSKKDLKLAKSVPEIDLVVGGHDHRMIETPLEVKHEDKTVPVVQTGSLGQKLGHLVVDVDLIKGLRVLKYELIPIEYKDDFETELKIEEGQNFLNDMYGKEFLTEQVGETSLPLYYNDHASTIWSKIVVEGIREGGGGEVAVNTGSLAGSDLPVGKFARQDLMNTYPRIFEFEEKDGWKVYNTKVSGWLLDLTIQICLSFGYHLDWSGLTFKIKNFKNGKRAAYHIRINGKKINPLKLYRLSVPEGIIRGGFGVTSLVRLIFISSGYTKTSIWQAIENKVKEIGPIDLNNPKVKAIENLINYQFVPRSFEN